MRARRLALGATVAAAEEVLLLHVLCVSCVRCVPVKGAQIKFKNESLCPQSPEPLSMLERQHPTCMPTSAAARSHRKVAVAPQKLALCRQAVAPRAPRLLEIGLQGGRHAPVDQAPDVGFVNALCVLMWECGVCTFACDSVL